MDWHNMNCWNCRLWAGKFCEKCTFSEPIFDMRVHIDHWNFYLAKLLGWGWGYVPPCLSVPTPMQSINTILIYGQFYFESTIWTYKSNYKFMCFGNNILSCCQGNFCRCLSAIQDSKVDPKRCNGRCNNETGAHLCGNTNYVTIIKSKGT